MLFRLSPNYIKRDRRKENKKKMVRGTTDEVKSLLFIFHPLGPYILFRILIKFPHLFSNMRDKIGFGVL